MHNITTLAELDTILAEGNPVVLDITAPAWCPPCKLLEPHYNAAEAQVPLVTFVKADADNAHEISAHFGVMSVPTVLFFPPNGGEVQKVQARTVLKIIDELDSLTQE